MMTIAGNLMAKREGMMVMLIVIIAIEIHCRLYGRGEKLEREGEMGRVEGFLVEHEARMNHALQTIGTDKCKFLLHGDFLPAFPLETIRLSEQKKYDATRSSTAGNQPWRMCVYVCG